MCRDVQGWVGLCSDMGMGRGCVGVAQGCVGFRRCM